MGTDDLFHKRKSRDLKSFLRQQGKREPYDLVLIVCEGEKTEPNYFKGLCRTYGLSNTNIEITTSKKNDPLNIVNFAIEIRKKKQYDKVFCVFDKDQHSNYTNALAKIKKEKNLYAITSVPCFEYWLLLHFKHTSAPYQQTQKGHKSESQQLNSQLKKYIKDYCKGRPNIFEQTKKHLHEAIERAKVISGQQKKQRNG